LTLINDDQQPLHGRVAAIYTLKQLDGASSHAALVSMADQPALKEFALRALTDLRSQNDSVPVEPLLQALKDPHPRVRAQALISLGRLGRRDVAASILPLTVRQSALPTAKPLHAQADPDRVLPHLAVRALIALEAVEPCLQALDGPYAEGAFNALKWMHSDATVDGLVRQLATARDPQLRQQILTTLIRLHYREAEYAGDWWGTRPDTRGPYYDRQTWSQSDRIARLLRTAILDADAATAEQLRGQLARHRVRIDGLEDATDVAASAEETQAPIEIPTVDTSDSERIANMPYEEAVARAGRHPGDPALGEKLFTRHSCIACHTYADGQVPKGPHLVDIGKRYKRSELIESVLKPSAKIAQGFETFGFATSDGRITTGFVVSESAESVRVRQNNGVAVELPKQNIDERLQQSTSMMPQGLAGNLTPEELADLLAYLESLK
jgi:putative heme-binding domain-containing protein